MTSDETSQQRDRAAEIERINQVYATRRASGLKDGDTGFGAIDSSREGADWRYRHGWPNSPGIVGALAAAGVKL